MQEDDSVRSYVERITKFVTCIKSFVGTISEDEVCYKILRSLTLTYDNKVNALEEAIPFIKDFNRETLIAKLQAFETSRLRDNFPKLKLLSKLVCVMIKDY